MSSQSLTPEVRTTKLGTHRGTGAPIYYYVLENNLKPQVEVTDNPKGQRTAKYKSPISFDEVNTDDKIKHLLQNSLIDFHKHGDCFPSTRILRSIASVQPGLGSTRDAKSVMSSFLFRQKHSYGSEKEILKLFEAVLWDRGWRIDCEAAQAARADVIFERCESVLKSEHWINHPPVKILSSTAAGNIDQYIGNQRLDTDGNLVIKGAMKTESETALNENKKRRIEQ